MFSSLSRSISQDCAFIGGGCSFRTALLNFYHCFHYHQAPLKLETAIRSSEKSNGSGRVWVPHLLLPVRRIDLPGKLTSLSFSSTFQNQTAWVHFRPRGCSGESDSLFVVCWLASARTGTSCAMSAAFTSKGLAPPGSSPSARSGAGRWRTPSPAWSSPARSAAMGARSCSSSRRCGATSGSTASRAIRVPVPGVRLLRGVRAAPPRPHPGRARPRQDEQLQPRRVRVAGVAVPEQAAVPGAPGPCGTARVPAAQRRGRSLRPVAVGGLSRPAPRGQPVDGVQAGGGRRRPTRRALAVGMHRALYAQLGGATPYWQVPVRAGRVLDLLQLHQRQHPCAEVDGRQCW